MVHEGQTRNPLRALLSWRWCDSKEFSTRHSEGHRTLHLQWISEFFLPESCKLAPPSWMTRKPHGVQHGSSHRFIVTRSILKDWKILHKNLGFFQLKNIRRSGHMRSAFGLKLTSRLSHRAVFRFSPPIPDCPPPSHWCWYSVWLSVSLFCFFPQVLFNHMYFLTCTCD